MATNDRKPRSRLSLPQGETRPHPRAGEEEGGERAAKPYARQRTAEGRRSAAGGKPPPTRAPRVPVAGTGGGYRKRTVAEAGAGGYRKRSEGFAGKPAGFRKREDGVEGTPGSHRTRAGGFESKPGGYRKREDGFPDKPAGYRKREGGFPDKPAGYRKREGGFPDKPAGYRKREGGFPDKPAGYRKREGGFPDKPAGYRKREGGYESKPAGYRQREGGFESKPAGYRKREGGFGEGVDRRPGAITDDRPRAYAKTTRAGSGAGFGQARPTARQAGDERPRAYPRARDDQWTTAEEGTAAAGAEWMPAAEEVPGAVPDFETPEPTAVAPLDPDTALREAVIATARKMNALGINQARSGNVSVRSGDGFLITPSAMDYDRLRPEDIVFVRLDGTHEGDRAPSSEWRFHRDLFASRPDCGAVVHTHGPHATTLACLRRGLPSFHYMVAKAGGADIRCAPYATFGTQELSDHALAALEGRKACLLANHGMIVIGGDLDAALNLAVEVEALCGQYWRALQLGEPILLDADEMARVVEKFRTHGQPAVASATAEYD